MGLAQDLPARTVCRASSQPKSVTVMMYAITRVTLLETPARLQGQKNAKQRMGVKIHLPAQVGQDIL